MSHQTADSKRAGVLTYGLAALLLAGSAAVGATFGIATANADCVTASGGASVDCDGMLYGDLNSSTQGDSRDGSTQGEMCGAMPGTVPRCN